MMPKRTLQLCLVALLSTVTSCWAQQAEKDSLDNERVYKNVIRYDLSGGVIFGFDRYIVIGYERVIKKRQSFSVNFGKISLPKFLSVSTGDIELTKDVKSSGFNASVDYRFYLKKENRYLPPHGLYIGPYYSMNNFSRSNEWLFNNEGADSFINTDTDFTIHAVGFEVGYQFIVWKRLAIDMLMFGPGVGYYDYNVNIDSNLDAETQSQLFDGLEQLLTQKFPGMNYVFADKNISGSGTMRTTTLGYRFIIHIGFVF